MPLRRSDNEFSNVLSARRTRVLDRFKQLVGNAPPASLR